MKKVLIVEDEIIIGLDIANKLKKLGYHIIDTATSPAQAIEAIEAEVPNIIIMDINLNADIDGIELADKIRENYGIPVVFMTSYSDGSMVDRAMNAEPYGYIIKPYTESVLVATLKTSFTRLELERRTSQQHSFISGIMDRITDAVAVVDSACRIERANRVFSEVTCTVNPEGCHISEIFSETINDETIKRLHEEGSHEVFKVRLCGVDKHLLISASDFAWEQGVKIILTITDLTEIHSVKNELSKAEQRFTKIFKKKMVPAVLVSCPDMSVYEMNDAFTELYKITDENYVDKNIACLIGEEAVSEIRSTACEDMSVQGNMIRQSDLNGREFFVNIRGKKVEFDGQEYFLMDFNDITEQMRVAEMERELQQKLIHANKMTSLGTLVSGVAHEINNPNNFIMFNSSLLTDFWDDIFNYLQGVSCRSIAGMTLDEFKNDIENLMNGISNGSERIKNIVQDLKGFAKTESSEVFEQIDIDEVLRTAVRILEHQISKSTDNFVLDIESGLPPVQGNIQKLEQVFINVLMNALEAIQSNAALVELRCFKSDSNVIIEVQDEGVGIPGECLDRITEPFFTTKQSNGGTGLGLSIAYTIIKEHGGNIDIVSSVGKGTVVRITLPEM